MFVASLNLDLFFKKVFSNKRIAKRFLEDILGVRITDIKLLGTEHKLSDDSVKVKFDFRCKIHGKYVVIEMQQKYKTDVNKRFYLYHCVGTALQLETLEPITVTKPSGETYTEKNYNGLEPVITIIWMADETFNFKDDIIVYSTLPEAAKDFITNDTLWSQPFDVIQAERAKTLNILDNKTKDLDFFSENRLIYVFQKNIVFNKLDTIYFKWFDFAQKSKNPNNIESEFDNFKNDTIMAEVLKRLKKDNFPKDDFNYLANLRDYQGEMLVEKELELRELKKKLEAKYERQLKRSLKNELNREKTRAEEMRKAEQQKTLKAIKHLLLRGYDIPTIADLLQRSLEETTDLVRQIQD